MTLAMGKNYAHKSLSFFLFFLKIVFIHSVIFKVCTPGKSYFIGVLLHQENVCIIAARKCVYYCTKKMGPLVDSCMIEQDATVA